jgi:hypothetical protein
MRCAVASGVIGTAAARWVGLAPQEVPPGQPAVVASRSLKQFPLARGFVPPPPQLPRPTLPIFLRLLRQQLHRPVAPLRLRAEVVEVLGLDPELHLRVDLFLRHRRAQVLLDLRHRVADRLFLDAEPRLELDRLRLLPEELHPGRLLRGLRLHLTDDLVDLNGHLPLFERQLRRDLQQVGVGADALDLLQALLERGEVGETGTMIPPELARTVSDMGSDF